MIHHPVEVKALENYKIWLKYPDNKEGVIDLSHLIGSGVFKAWEDELFFKKVYIDPETGAVAWNETIELCPETLYEKLIKLMDSSLNEPDSEYASN
ncbi:MAG TPA: DUF2442 domain-containing protein [Bacteroidia bacterium]|nr:DUF2442 domain-containing protein [Bacteroidia bacterium]HRS57964.1 DUF2442 domain-containing protein [Bacteroidia bacterium]HRU68007.1 DUF2442 domain-containing protein [Bacteroidia bacterium]